MANASNWIACCCLAVMVALYAGGDGSNGSLRHDVQTSPLWFPIVMGFRQNALAKWSALPCLILWMVIARFICLAGRLSAIETVMTPAIEIACVSRIAIGLRWRPAVLLSRALGVAALFATMQLLAVCISRSL